MFNFLKRKELKLDRCRKCWDEDIVVHIMKFNDLYWIDCNNCHARIHSNYPKKKDAIKNWNEFHGISENQYMQQKLINKSW